MKKPFAITLEVGSSLANQTGAWRTSRPVYVDRLPPCNDACPAGENIQQWLYHAETGNYRAAWEQLVLDNPLPAIMGRACYHRCESACNRGQLDQPVGIHAVERFLGDLALTEHWPLPAPAVASSGKRVLVIGAGPGGLSAAYHLVRLGHAVTIREAAPLSGGMMRYGIPRYRLPREILDAEVQRILDLGVKLELGARVDDIPAAMAEGGFDACFAAVGAHLAKKVDVPVVDAERIVEAVSMLRGLEGGETLRLGRRVVVYGGGNTAMDAARTARRLGSEAMIVYRRTKEQMPAHISELEEALEEGVAVSWLRTVKEVGEGAMTVEKMTIGPGGKAVPTGELETIEGDTLVLALGQDADLDPLKRLAGVRIARDGSVEVGPDLMSGHPGLFCGGDMVAADRTITVAVGHGKKAARNIDSYVRGERYRPAKRHELAASDKLNFWYYTDADRTVQPVLDDIRRRTTFAEVHGGLDAGNALLEARRCLSCGNCFECDNCFGVCPDNAVVKLGAGQGFRIDLDFCKGCGLCAKECPCGSIAMVAEET